MTTITMTWIGVFVSPVNEVPPSVERARCEMKRRGWSQRRAADRLGISQGHLNRVLNGKLRSRRLLQELSELEPSPIPYRVSGFARSRKGASK